MGNILAFIVIVLLAVGAIAYIVLSKKRGRTCIGCPGGCCSKNGSCGTCMCHGVCTHDKDSETEL